MKIEDVLRKLKFKDNPKSIIINAPIQIEREFKKKGFATKPSESVKYEFTILFTQDRSEVEKLAKPTIENIEYDSVLWLAYPKGSSSINTDINRDKLVGLLKPHGYRPVSLISMDSDWSVMRFRPTDKVKSK